MTLVPGKQCKPEQAKRLREMHKTVDAYRSYLDRGGRNTFEDERFEPAHSQAILKLAEAAQWLDELAFIAETEPLGRHLTKESDDDGAPEGRAGARAAAPGPSSG